MQITSSERATWSWSLKSRAHLPPVANSGSKTAIAAALSLAPHAPALWPKRNSSSEYYSFAAPSPFPDNVLFIVRAARDSFARRSQPGPRLG